MINTGMSAMKKLAAFPGNFSGGIVLVPKKPAPGVALIFFNVVENKGPAMMMVGILMMMPYNKVIPTSALNIAASPVGPGCGGKKPWVTERDAAIGMATQSKGLFAFLAMEKTNGTRIIKPAL